MSSVKLQSSWRWELMVKLREKYIRTDFLSSLIPLSDQTDDLDMLIRLKNYLPRFSTIKQVNLALFRDNIPVEWEHEINRKCSVWELVLKKSGSGSTVEGTEGYTTDEELDAVFDWFFITMISGVFEKGGRINGLYIKVKNQCYTFQIWGDQEPIEKTVSVKAPDILKEVLSLNEHNSAVRVFTMAGFASGNKSSSKSVSGHGSTHRDHNSSCSRDRSRDSSQRRGNQSHRQGGSRMVEPPFPPLKDTKLGGSSGRSLYRSNNN